MLRKTRSKAYIESYGSDAVAPTKSEQKETLNRAKQLATNLASQPEDLRKAMVLAEHLSISAKHLVESANIYRQVANHAHATTSQKNHASLKFVTLINDQGDALMRVKTFIAVLHDPKSSDALRRHTVTGILENQNKLPNLDYRRSALQIAYNAAGPNHDNKRALEYAIEDLTPTPPRPQPATAPNLQPTQG